MWPISNFLFFNDSLIVTNPIFVNTTQETICISNVLGLKGHAALHPTFNELR